MKNLSIAATLFLTASAARAVDFIAIQAYFGAAVTINERTLVNNGTTTEWQIDITVSGGNPSALVSIRPQTSTNNYPIRYIKVRSVWDGVHNNNANIVIDEGGGGHISILRSVQTLTASPSPDAEVWISKIDISGTLGDPGSPHTSDGVFADVIGTIDAGSITSDILAIAPLFGGSSTITHVGTYTGGSILGDIGSEAGGILEVHAASNIGSSGSPIYIIGTGSGGNIGVVTGSSVYADIVTDTAAGAHGDTKQIVATTGNFVGSLTTYALQGTGTGVPAIDIAGNLDADLDVETVKRPITVDGSLPSGRTITVHQDVQSTGPITFGTGGLQGLLNIGTNTTSGSSLAGTVTVPANGLGGQIIINSTNNSGTWTGSVIVGGTTLATAPQYSNLSSAIGGGAVGLVPFDIQGAECIPANGDTVCMGDLQENWGTDGAPDWRETVVIRHYGPVFNSQSGNPYVVNRQDLACPYGSPCPGAATDISSSCTVSTGHGPNRRDVWICLTPVGGVAQSFGSGYRYTITNHTTSSLRDLRCDDTLAATDPEVADYTFTFDSLCN